MKVLFVSRYAQPNIKFCNENVYKQASTLVNLYGVKVEILTWPLNDQWSGPRQNKSRGLEVPPMQVEAGGIRYHVIAAPERWNERTMSHWDWEQAVAFGVQLLSVLKPDIVHLQHWHGLWWILESAQRLQISTAYTNHDWGLGCLRTVLVKGDGTLCNSNVGVSQCSRCIWQGRGIVGKINELLVQSKFGEGFLSRISKTSIGDFLSKRGMVRMGIRARVQTHMQRCQKILLKLDALFVPSTFARTFFSRLGTPREKVSILPWYYDHLSDCNDTQRSESFTISYVGRVSPEKGVHLLFEALGALDEIPPVTLRIVGANDSKYSKDLRKSYCDHAGKHRVEWIGWTAVAPIYRTTDVIVIPSVWIDNTPLVLIEALSHKVPVIATRVGPMEEMIVDGVTGFLFDYNSPNSLRESIVRAYRMRTTIREGKIRFNKVMTCQEYTGVLVERYKAIYLEAER